MQSLASLMSVNTTGDIAPLEDFEEEEGKVIKNITIVNHFIEHVNGL